MKISSRVLALAVLALSISSPFVTAQTESDKLSQKQQANAMKWKERILKVPVGSFVKAKFQNHEELEGQLRDISDSSFSIQVLKDNKIETIAIRYEDMKSLSVDGHPSTGAKVAKGIFMSAF